MRVEPFPLLGVLVVRREKGDMQQAPCDEICCALPWHRGVVSPHLLNYPARLCETSVMAGWARMGRVLVWVWAARKVGRDNSACMAC